MNNIATPRNRDTILRRRRKRRKRRKRTPRQLSVTMNLGSLVTTSIYSAATKTGSQNARWAKVVRMTRHRLKEGYTVYVLPPEVDKKVLKKSNVVAKLGDGAYVCGKGQAKGVSLGSSEFKLDDGKIVTE